MYLFLVNKLAQLKITDHEFFKAAHQWCFNRCPVNLDPDVLTFREHGIVPKYVEAFVKHLMAD